MTMAMKKNSWENDIEGFKRPYGNSYAQLWTAMVGPHTGAWVLILPRSGGPFFAPKTIVPDDFNAAKKWADEIISERSVPWYALTSLTGSS